MSNVLRCAGIPGLPRVLDALSTIMWPSMVAASSSSSKLGLNTRNKRDWEWARGSRDDNDDAASPLGGLLRGGGSRRDEEMKELTRWLEDDDGGENPWPAAADSGLMTSPTGMDAPAFEGWEKSAGEKEGGKEGKVGGFGFDDDFTVFVSAPPPGDDSFDMPNWDEEEEEEPKGLGARKMYRYSALGSSQDLREGTGDGENELGAETGTDGDGAKGDEVGGSGVKEGKGDTEDEEDEEGLPTDAEIEAMSARIFGHAPTTLGMAAGLNAIPLDLGAGAGGEDYDMAPFDLSQVMSALEGMKAEIAGMPDEAERRKAAARVALGLVYGLEADAGLDEL